MTRPSLAAFSLALFLVSSFGTTSVRADDTETAAGVRPRYKFGPDDKLIYRSTLSLDMEQTVNEQKIPVKMETSEVTVRTLEKVDDEGRFELRAENERLKVQLEVGPAGKYEFDSTSTERDKESALGAALTPLHERLTGAYLWSTIDSRGEVVKTRGYADLVKDVVKDNPIASQFASGGSEEAYRASLSQMFVTFPEQAIEPGDDWTTDVELALPSVGDIVGKTTYTFEKLVTEKGHRIAEFTIRSELALDIEIEQPGNKITGRVQTEKSEGRMRFDVTAGRLLSHTESHTIGGTLNLAVAGQNLTVPLKQQQQVKFELLDELPE